MGHSTEALDFFDRAIELNPGLEDWCRYQQGLIHLVKNNPVQAQKKFLRALELARQTYQEKPKNWINTFNLALYSLASGDVETAEKLYQTAIKDPSSLIITLEALRDVDDFLNLFPEREGAQVMHSLLQQHWDQSSEQIEKWLAKLEA